MHEFSDPVIVKFNRRRGYAIRTERRDHNDKVMDYYYLAKDGKSWLPYIEVDQCIYELRYTAEQELEKLSNPDYGTPV